MAQLRSSTLIQSIAQLASRTPMARKTLEISPLIMSTAPVQHNKKSTTKLVFHSLRTSLAAITALCLHMVRQAVEKHTL